MIILLYRRLAYSYLCGATATYTYIETYVPEHLILFVQPEKKTIIYICTFWNLFSSAGIFIQNIIMHGVTGHDKTLHVSI